MSTAAPMASIRALIDDVDFTGKSLISINSMTDDQLYRLFELGKALEPFNRSGVDILRGAILGLLFFQPSTRTRMSFETAITRLGGTALVETSPEVSSSIAKEESLEDMMRCVSQYANAIVLRHYDADAARSGAERSSSPIINGGWGHWEHPTQALLDLYTMWRTFGRIKGVNVCIAAADLIEARTGHSMAYGLARLGAHVTLASPKDRRTPDDVVGRIRKEFGADVSEEFDCDQDSFNRIVADMDVVYLPGCSAPKGSTAEQYKQMMDDYFVRYETLEKAQSQGKTIYVTHTLPRRAGEIDLRIDDSPSQLYFEAILHSVSLRMALVAAILG